VILALFFISFKKPVVPPSHSTSKKVTLNLSSFQLPTPKPQIKQQTTIQQTAHNKPNKIVKKTKTKSKTKQKIVKKTKSQIKKKIVKHPKKSNYTKKIKQSTKKRNIRKYTKIKPHKSKSIKRKTKKRYTPQKTKQKKYNSLSNILAHRKSKYTTSDNRFGMSTIHKLYGNEYNSFSKKQKEFIRNNLSRIYQITQRTLILNGYPEVAGRTHQEGTNIVSFYLHPNGDISNLKLKKRIGYSALDNNTLQVIKIAYKDYPLPAKTTKIVFYVTYSIY
jgi:TonB family protein